MLKVLKTMLESGVIHSFQQPGILFRLGNGTFFHKKMMIPHSFQQYVNLYVESGPIF